MKIDNETINNKLASVNDTDDLNKKVLACISLISCGNTENKACKLLGIELHEFKRILRKHPELLREYNIAIETCEEIIAENLLSPEEWVKAGAKDSKEAALWSKNVQWFLSKRRPDKYGDKITIENKVTVQNVILSRLESGLKRIQIEDESNIIDAEVIEHQEVALDN